MINVFFIIVTGFCAIKKNECQRRSSSAGALQHKPFVQQDPSAKKPSTKTLHPAAPSRAQGYLVDPIHSSKSDAGKNI